MIIQPSAPRNYHFPPNMYRVTCVGIREGQLQNPQYGNGEVVFLQLQSEIRDPETGEWAMLERMCNPVWSPKSALWACAEALGYPCKVGEPLDTDRLMGRQCQALVKDEVGSDGQVYSRVDTLVPLMVQMPQPQAEPLMQRMNQAAGVPSGVPPWEAPPPPANPLAQQLHERADELAQQGHDREMQAFPPLNILTQGGAIDWEVFWREAGYRGINRGALATRLNLYERELDDHLRQMLPLAVIELLKPRPVP